MSDVKPITVYAHPFGPNPKKVFILLEELGIPYNRINITEFEGDGLAHITANGRVPAIDDPNTGLKLWESGAILEYIVDQYDKENKFTFTTWPEKYLLKQYLHFQMSGQGPYYGQLFWFYNFHPEDVPSAKERYVNQAVRVIRVLDKSLEGKTYLVGEKYTFIDIAFVSWNDTLFSAYSHLFEKFELEENYPNFVAWHKRLLERPAVLKGLGKAPGKT